MKHVITILLILLPTWASKAQITIEECVAKAEANYPLVRKFDLMSATRDVELSDINKSWLPGIGVYAQVTAQNVVPSFPETLTGVLEQMGQQMKGLGKVQYKAGVDVMQTIWDGGASSARIKVASAQHSVQKSALDVELYAVRQRVENLYFSILLLDEQIAQSRITADLLSSNLNKLRSMYRNGAAMQSDVDMVEAQALAVEQNIKQAQSAVKGYRLMLGIFIGDNVDNVVLTIPQAQTPLAADTNRPELKLFDNQLAANNALRGIDNAALM
ncbi:MAG: TolC family protein, partial [Muribaculaceae bacterium]|nr:TolC family protein [Muribaculaceae bacterium]